MDRRQVLRIRDPGSVTVRSDGARSSGASDKGRRVGRSGPPTTPKPVART